MLCPPRRPSHANRSAGLVGAHYHPLYRFARSLTKSAADASDLVQETFLIWAQKGGQLRNPAKAKAWLFTTLYREFLRSRRRDKRFCSVHDLPGAVLEAGGMRNDPAPRIDAAAMLKTLQDLDGDYRMPLVLFYLEGRSYKEIAASIGIPVGTVMTRLYRGKERLRLVLDGRPCTAGAESHG